MGARARRSGAQTVSATLGEEGGADPPTPDDDDLATLDADASAIPGDGPPGILDDDPATPDADTPMFLELRRSRAMLLREIDGILWTWLRVLTIRLPTRKTAGQLRWRWRSLKPCRTEMGLLRCGRHPHT